MRLEGVWWWSHGMTSDLILLRGFQQVLYDLHDNPDGLHQLMAFFRDENLAELDFLQANGLLSLNNGGDFVGTGGYGWSDQLPSPASMEGRCAPSICGAFVRARKPLEFHRRNSRSSCSRTSCPSSSASG